MAWPDERSPVRGNLEDIELEPTGHPLAVEQRSGISMQRVAEILSAYLHA